MKIGLNPLATIAVLHLMHVEAIHYDSDLLYLPTSASTPGIMNLLDNTYSMSVRRRTHIRTKSSSSSSKSNSSSSSSSSSKSSKSSSISGSSSSSKSSGSSSSSSSSKSRSSRNSSPSSKPSEASTDSNKVTQAPIVDGSSSSSSSSKLSDSSSSSSSSKSRSSRNSSPSSKPSEASTDSKKVTQAPTVDGTDASTTGDVVPAPTAATLTTKNPTASPILMTDMLTSTHPTPHPTESIPTDLPTGSPSATISNQLCAISSGSFGTETASQVSVQYFYRMEYRARSTIQTMMTDLEHSITEAIVTSSGLFPNCEIGNNVVGITSDPSDQVNSNCGDTCVIVEGRLTLFLASSNKRRLRLGHTESETTLSTIENGMERGEFQALYPDIVSLDYLLPSDASIVNDEGKDKPSSGSTEDSDKSPATRGVPSYGYAMIASAATVIIAVMAVSGRCRRIYTDTQEDEEGEDDDLKALSPSKDASIAESPEVDNEEGKSLAGL